MLMVCLDSSQIFFLKKRLRECSWSAWTALRNYFLLKKKTVRMLMVCLDSSQRFSTKKEYSENAYGLPGQLSEINFFKKKDTSENAHGLPEQRQKRPI
jgi:hypothetical protein